MCLNPYLKKMSSQINDCSYIWVNCYIITNFLVFLPLNNHYVK